MEKWFGKVAVITGASVGIGRATATQLVENGMKVVGCDRNFEQLNELASQVNKSGKGEMLPYKCDVSKEDEILGMFQFIKEKFGTIHVCVNNAGMSFESTFFNGTAKEWRYMFDVNVLGLSIVTHEAVSLMRASGVDDGHIINMNSMSGHRVTVTMYSATKFAVTAISEGLRKELHDENSHIRVTCISPGLVETQFLYSMHPTEPEKAKEMYGSLKCLQPDDIASAMVYVLTAPPHMNVNEIYIRPVEQKY